jgi:hypothetical protein
MAISHEANRIPWMVSNDHDSDRSDKDLPGDRRSVNQRHQNDLEDDGGIGIKSRLTVV